jgi:hypothetical protein
VSRTAAVIRGKQLDVHFYKVYKSSTNQWLGHVLAFDASDEQNEWPLFLESDRNVVLDKDEDANAELEQEYLYMEELNRAFLNLGSGNTDFSVHWY